ncbi:MAG: trigger factor [Vulcanimicrobiota bacterium]
MKVDVKKGQDSTVTLEITIDSEKLEESYNKRLNEAARGITIPGFRKGKAPVRLAEKHLNKQILMSQVMEDCAIPALQDALEKENLTPLNKPSMDVIQLERGKDMIFKTTFEIKPQVELEGYAELEITQEKPDVKDEDVEGTIRIMQQNAAQLEEIKEDRGIEVGDSALVDFEGNIDGEPIPNGNAKDYVMEMKEDMFITGFIDNLKGLRKGEEKKFTVTFPEDYGSEVLKGKTVDFHFKIHAIKHKVLAELNDDFAKEVSTSQTLDELRAELRKKLQKKVDEQAIAQVEEKVADILTGKVTEPLPASLISYETQVLLDDMRRNFAAQGVQLESYLAQQGRDPMQFVAALKPQADRMGKLEMAIESIIRKENIEISDEEVDAKIKEISDELKQDFNKLKETLKKEGRIPSLKYAMLKKKTMDFVVGKAKISYVPAGSTQKEDEPEIAKGEEITEEHAEEAKA